MSPKAKELISRLQALSCTVGTAESCTGGLIAKMLTDVPGASSVFPGGIVSYCDRVKNQLLDVPQDMLTQYSAVSAEVAEAMAIGVCHALHTDFGISATGYAGPNDENTGLVFVAAAFGERALVKELHLEGDREAVRQSAADCALQLLSDLLQGLL